MGVYENLKAEEGTNIPNSLWESIYVTPAVEGWITLAGFSSGSGL